MNTSKTFLKKNILLIIAVIYLLLPIDLIPDRLPLVGNLDDATLFVIALIRKYIEWKKHVVREDVKKDQVQEGEIVR